jgi:hypothetical protein
MIDGRLEGQVISIFENVTLPFGQRVLKRAGPFVSGAPARGFMTLWHEGGAVPGSRYGAAFTNAQVSGYFGADGIAVGPVVMTATINWTGLSVPMRYEG